MYGHIYSECCSILSMYLIVQAYWGRTGNANVYIYFSA